ncbi:MAG: hypothetical protein H0T44_11700 [Gemmatimonadales bacterium]|nr:hypothetical protein [Gemmatimonadales bacterium]
MSPTPATILAFVLTLAGPLAAQRQKLPVSPSVPAEALAGQSVAVMPLTLVAAEPALESDSAYAPYRDRRTTLLLADSLIGEALTGRAPEVQWVLPPTLRKLARRSPGIVGDPDQMGQAALRAPMKDIPDPLRSSLRKLVAVAGGRVAMVPAALAFGRGSDGRIRADLTLVAADTRAGKVLWRSVAIGTGATPREALQAALTGALPL